MPTKKQIFLEDYFEKDSKLVGEGGQGSVHKVRIKEEMIHEFNKDLLKYPEDKIE